jgi:transcriptional regulator with XRE-family HTH domain
MNGMGEKDFRSAIDFVNEFVSNEAKERFELDDILYNISMMIFDYRIQNNLSQKGLAEKLGVTQAMVSKLESGQYNPSVEQLWKISKKLNLKFAISLEVQEDEKTGVWDTQEYRLGNIEDNIRLMECS